MAIIGISGKIGAGKDLVGNIIQYLTSAYKREYYTGKRRYTLKQYNKQSVPTNISSFSIKKFATKLKEGCEHDFPNEFSVKEWETGNRAYREGIMPSLGITRRKFLTSKGDACGSIHKDYFVNALMNEYKPVNMKKRQSMGNVIDYSDCFPNWIITDVRFPNELKAVKDRGGVTIRINRIKVDDIVYWEDPEGITSGVYKVRSVDDSEAWIIQQDSASEAQVPIHEIEIFKDPEHISETALDSSKFDYVINNNGTIEDLIEKVEEILIKEKII